MVIAAVLLLAHGTRIRWMRFGVSEQCDGRAADAGVDRGDTPPVFADRVESADAAREQGRLPPMSCCGSCGARNWKPYIRHRQQMVDYGTRRQW